MGIRRISAEGLYASSIEVHPTFLYESLWNLIGFILIAIFYKKKKFNGQVFYFYMIWYGLGRAIIEGLRSDSLYIAGNENLRVSQILAAIVCITGIVLMTVNFLKLKQKAVLSDANDAVQSLEASADILTKDMQKKITAETQKTNTLQGEMKDGGKDH